MAEIAPRFAPATAGEQIDPGLTCGDGRQTFSRWVHRSADGAAGMPSAAGERAGEYACADGLA